MAVILGKANCSLKLLQCNIDPMEGFLRQTTAVSPVPYSRTLAVVLNYHYSVIKIFSLKP